jgi:hypothetical protein
MAYKYEIQYDVLQELEFTDTCIELGRKAAMLDYRLGDYTCRDAISIRRRALSSISVLDELVQMPSDATRKMVLVLYLEAFQKGYTRYLREQTTYSVPVDERHRIEIFFDPPSDSFGYRVWYDMSGESHSGEDMCGFASIDMATCQAFLEIEDLVTMRREFYE